jgi:hypothetical protein
MNYWEIVNPTFLENWPAALHSLSIASIDIPLTVDDARRLGTNIIEFGDSFCETPEQRSHNERAADYANEVAASGFLGKGPVGEPVEFIKVKCVREDIGDIRTRVQESVVKFPNGAFVRLGSRSPKDSWEGHRHGFKASVGDDPLRFILDCSERMYEDLTLAIQHNYAPHIWVRQWMTIPRWAEFRCFMKARKLVGISQYNYLQGESFPEIVRDADTIRWVIADQFFPTFKAASHLDDVVFDVWVKASHQRDNTRVWEVRLVEVNPLFELTDPCLFQWGKQFNGKFRYNR